MTLVEVVVAAGISTMVIGTGLSIFLATTGAWVKGESQMSQENETRNVVRLVADELREAMWVSIDSDGMGITYRKPVKTGTGEFQVPATWDGLDRRIYLSAGKLLIEPQTGQARVVCRNVLDKDPFALVTSGLSAQTAHGSVTGTGAPAYKVFVSNSGTLTTEVTVQIVTGKGTGRNDEVVRSRKRETVVLRNVPELIK